MAKYNHRAAPVDAMQFDGTSDNAKGIIEWSCGKVFGNTAVFDTALARIVVRTPTGTRFADPGDWIFRDADNKYHVRSAERFASDFVAADKTEEIDELKTICDDVLNNTAAYGAYDAEGLTAALEKLSNIMRRYSGVEITVKDP